MGTAARWALVMPLPNIGGQNCCLCPVAAVAPPLLWVWHKAVLWARRSASRWDNPSGRNRWDNPSDSIDSYSAYQISSHSELTIGSPRHDFIDSGKSRMKRHAYAISGIQPLEHISRAPRGVATQDGMVTHPHTTHDADGCLHENHQAKPTDA